MPELKLLEKMNPASYKGFEFLVPAESARRGQKVVVHEYPNSDKRYAEPLGIIPAIIDLTCIIHGEEYFDNRLIFEETLEQDGSGELIHPIYGSIEVQPGEFTVKSNQRRIGEFIFEVKFYVSEIVEPISFGGFGGAAFDQFELSVNALFAALEGAYMDPEDGFSLSGAVDSALGALDSVNEAINSVLDPIQSALASVSSTISKFRNGVFNIMKTAAGFKDSLLSTYNDLVQLKYDISTLANAWKDLIDFERTRPDKPDNTASRKIVKNNSEITAEHTRLMGLMGLIASDANTEFNNTDELENSLKFTDERFADYLEKEPGLLASDPEVRQAISLLRVMGKAALDKQASKIWRTTQINPGKSSMALTTYRYYGDLDNLDNMIKLNPSTSVANFKTKIRAVTK